jgi:tetratricopeptide (TPR) repeat protein
MHSGLPAAELTPDLLFKLLTAELRYQRGQWQAAYMTMMGAAQQTRDPRLARRAAEMALGVKQNSEAYTALRLWHELAPASEEAVQYLLSFILLSDDPEAARPILAQRLEQARPATRALMMFQTQRLLARAKNKEAAFQLLEDLLAPYSAMPEARLALAQAATANGDNARARMEARQALEARPDMALAALTLAQVTPDKHEAMAVLEQFLAAHPTSREVRIAYSRMLVDQKQYERARAQFEAILKTQPDDLTSLYALGLLSTQINDIASAEKHLARYIELLAEQPSENRDPTQALLVLAQIAEERNDSETALKWLAQIDSGEAYLNAQIKRAQIIAKQGDMENARALLDALQPSEEREQIQLLAAEARLLRVASRHAEALSVLQDGLERFPDNAELLYDHAMVAEKLDQLDVMEASLRKLMELEPNNQHAYNALGYSLAERNTRLQEAYALIETALKLAPDDPFIMDSMGWVMFRLGKLDEAEQLLRRAYEIRPDAEIAAHLGEVLWVKGRREDAQNLWRDATRKDPQNDTLKSTLTRLHVEL